MQIDILFLVDRLEELVNEGWKIPGTQNVVLSEDRFMDLVDQMRLAIPAEIRQAQRVQQDRERILAQAKEEAQRMAKQAVAEVNKLVEDQALTQQSRARGEEIIAKAYQEAERIRQESDAYALETLQRLQQQLQSLQEQVRNGVTVLKQGQQSEPET